MQITGWLRDVGEENSGECGMANVTSRSRSAKECPDGSVQLDVMFRAVCDRTRVRILNVLRNGELCVGDIVQIIQVPQPRASRHLAYLKKAGLVLARREGLWIHYSLAPVRSEFHRKLLDCVITCFQEVPEIREDEARAKGLKSSARCCPKT